VRTYKAFSRNEVIFYARRFQMTRHTHAPKAKLERKAFVLAYALVLFFYLCLFLAQAGIHHSAIVQKFIQ
jgi:hypothetical protein